MKWIYIKKLDYETDFIFIEHHVFMFMRKL